MWEIEYYRKPNGECPTEDFIKSMWNSGVLPLLYRRLELLRTFGNQLTRPHVDYLENGIYELRISFKRNQIRLLYFFFYQDAIIISHGLRKESRVDPGEIRKAIANREDYFARYTRKK
jgi:phage-related protein